MSTALILSGGGARAAYQVGVLRALPEIIERDRLPFDIICGTSAGAINAAYLTAQIQRPRHCLVRLDHAWRRLSASEVYDTSWRSVLRSIFQIGRSLLTGKRSDSPSSLLDNSPLRELLKEWLDFNAVRMNLENGLIRHLCITAMNYNTGESIAFYEGADVKPWRRLHRRGEPDVLSLEHVMASAAIPILFPPQSINGHYFGDGALRQLHPLSPALHLGARRLFVIGVSSNRRSGSQSGQKQPPTVAQMAGHLLNREFIDNLEADIEQAELINDLLADCISDQHEKALAQRVDFLVITPSIAFDEVAVRYIKRQPSSMRLLFRLLGAEDQGAGASFASYLLFDGGFCKELSDTGYRDAYDNADAIREFFSDQSPA